MSCRLVLDASAALRIVLGEADAAALLELVGAAAVVTTPDLFCSEVANALWKYVRAGEIRIDDATDRYDQALKLVDEIVPSAELGTEALAAAARFEHPVYDMMYAVLARRHAAALLTRDRKLRRAAQELRVETA